MSSAFTKTQLFFKRKLLERISNPDTYKEFKNKFAISLDYDLTDEDIDYLTQIINQTDKMYNLNIRLSDTIKDKQILNKLLSIISNKKQVTYLNFYIKYLNDELFSEFLNFISNLNYSVLSFKLQLKYKENEITEQNTQQILENLIKNENFSFSYLYFINCQYSSKEITNLLNELMIKKRNKLKNVYLYNSTVYENSFDVDISTIKTAEISFFNLSKIYYLPKETLNLNNNNISLDGIKIISELIESPNCTLRKLNLNNNFIGDEGCSILSKGIKNNKSLVTLNLSNNNIIYQGLIDIAISLNSKSDDGIYNSTIQKLDFSQNSITNNAVVDFSEILKNEPEDRFLKINFQYNSINDLSIDHFGEFIQRYPNQRFVSLTNRISAEKKINFLNFCKKLKNIKKIMFQNFRFDEETSNLFNDILKNNENIENIFIYYNSFFYPEDIRNIIPGIEHNQNLIQLYLTQCKLGDEGAIAISEALFKNNNIAQIHLDDNEIGELGAKAISEKLLRKESLKKLVLSHNKIDSKGASHIGQYLENALGIQNLFINSNMIEDEGCEFLSKGIEKNKTLVQLNINNNGITNEGIKHIAKALLGKENFMALFIADNKITDVEEELYKLLDWCKKIVISANPLSKEGIMRLFQGTENNKLFKYLRFKILDEKINYNFKCNNKYLKDFDLSYNSKMNISLLNHVLSLPNLSLLNIQSNRLGDEKMVAISKYIKDNNIKLKKLELQSNFIGETGGKSIAELLKNNNYLTSINLAGNPLGYKGIKYICNAIELFENVLEELSLNYTQCNNYCSKDIYNMLINNKKLKIISLIGNFFNNEGIDIILSSLRLNNSLKELSIGENKNINSKGYLNLPSYLRFNQSLISLEIKSAKLNDDFLKQMIKSLKNNRKIISLNLNDNNLGYYTIMKFGLNIRKNDIINEVRLLLNKPQKDEQIMIKRCNPHLSFN